MLVNDKWLVEFIINNILWCSWFQKIGDYLALSEIQILIRNSNQWIDKLVSKFPTVPELPQLYQKLWPSCDLCWTPQSSLSQFFISLSPTTTYPTAASSTNPVLSLPSIHTPAPGACVSPKDVDSDQPSILGRQLQFWWESLVRFPFCSNSLPHYHTSLPF